MKLFSIIFLMSSINAFANSYIKFNTDNGPITVEWLGNEADESQLELLWDANGQKSIILGNFCFNGLRRNAIKILMQLDNIDMVGDELSLRNFKFIGRDRFSYEVYDGPNETIDQKNIVYPCKN